MTTLHAESKFNIPVEMLCDIIANFLKGNGIPCEDNKVQFCEGEKHVDVTNLVFTISREIPLDFSTTSAFNPLREATHSLPEIHAEENKQHIENQETEDNTASIGSLLTMSRQLERSLPKKDKIRLMEGESFEYPHGGK